MPISQVPDARELVVVTMWSIAPGVPAQVRVTDALWPVAESDHIPVTPQLPASPTSERLLP
ncbi:hypothetical protein HJC99_04655 [Candidatus Saccharibacteria bacterium]|nr:hypothetical protein [Candidatus Saccharibacteria bacterium]